MKNLNNSIWNIRECHCGFKYKPSRTEKQITYYKRGPKKGQVKKEEDVRIRGESFEIVEAMKSFQIPGGEEMIGFSVCPNCRLVYFSSE